MKNIVLILGLISSLIILTAGIKLTSLQSVGGGSLAEAYYQSVGTAVIGISFFTTAISLYCFTKLKSKEI